MLVSGWPLVTANVSSAMYEPGAAKSTVDPYEDHQARDTPSVVTDAIDTDSAYAAGYWATLEPSFPAAATKTVSLSARKYLIASNRDGSV